jgi:hypothetical protein
MKFLLFGPSYKGLSNTIKSAPQLIYPSLKSGFQFHQNLSFHVLLNFHRQKLLKIQYLGVPCV